MIFFRKFQHALKAPQMKTLKKVARDQRTIIFAHVFLLRNLNFMLYKVERRQGLMLNVCQ